MTDLRPDVLTWTALLGRWIEVAQGAVALPDDAEGQAWRASVPALINLQAVTFALGDLAALAAPDRPHARDRASVLIEQQREILRDIWHGGVLPEDLLEVLEDASAALAHAAFVGATELRCGPEPMVVRTPADMPAGPGSVAWVHDGTFVRPGTPIAWWVDRDAPDLDRTNTECVTVTLPHQVYRMIDDEGRIERDVVRTVMDDPVAGFPLLLPLLHAGEPVGAPSAAAATMVRRFQDAAGGAPEFEVVWEAEKA